MDCHQGSVSVPMGTSGCTHWFTVSGGGMSAALAPRHWGEVCSLGKSETAVLTSPSGEGLPGTVFYTQTYLCSDDVTGP
jgi:hypothetical protein